MFEKFKPKKEETPPMPTFEEMKMVLPEELRDEFQELGEAIEKYPTEEELMSDEEKKIEARYDELLDMAWDKRFEELKMVLPEELQDEFQKLGENAKRYEIPEESMSDEEKEIEARYGELLDMAKKLQSK